MYGLYSSLKPYYEKFLNRGKLYGLSPHEIHEMALNFFVKFLSLIILSYGKNDNIDSSLDARKIRITILENLFQKTIQPSQLFPEGMPNVLQEILKLSHIESQFKDSLSTEEWDQLVELLLVQNWTIEENFRNFQETESKISPEFLSYFYENILNDFENFFSLSPKISKRKHKGIFFTPWRIVREITDNCIDRFELQKPHFFQDKRKGFKILDPSCGTGSFLIYAAESIFQQFDKNNLSDTFLSQHIVENYVYGIDLSPSSLTVAKIRLLFWILNKSQNSISSLPHWLFRNIYAGNSLFGLCKESIQYPLDYSMILSRIIDYLGLDTENLTKQVAKAKENWLIASLLTKETKRDLIFPSTQVNSITKADDELFALVDILYQNWLINRLRKFPRPAPLKKGDLHTFSPFHWGIAFPEVMLRGGFDLIIGNPPYGRSILSRTEKSMLKLMYRACSGKNPKKYSLNAASAFIERSITLLKSNGIMGLIVPFSILRVEEFETLRELILERTTIWEIHDESAAFADVTLEMCSIFLTKKIEPDYDVTINPRPNIHVEPTVPISIFKKYNRFMIYYNNLWEKTASQGLVISGVVKGDYGIDHRILKKDLMNDYQSKYPIRYLHSGRSVSKFALNPKYFQWSKPHPTNERFTTYFREPRLVNTAIGNRFRVAYKPEKIVPGTNVSILEINNPSFHYFPMLILLNSDLINYLLKRYILNFSHLTVYLHKYYTQLIPIKYPHEFEDEFKILASYLVFVNQAHLCGKLFPGKRVDYLLNLMNYLVYDLYFPEILGISSNLAVNVGNYLKPIEIESFLDLILFQEEENDLDRLTYLIESNWQTIRQVTNKLRDDEEIRQHKKTIFNHEIVKCIRKEL